MDMVKIGRFIASLRKEKGLTQDELADKLGVTQKSVSRWETGKNLPDASLFKPLCDILGISINDLFAGEQIEKEQEAQKAEENIISIVRDSSRRKRILGRIIAVFAALSLIFLAAFTGASSKASKLKTDLDGAQKEIQELKDQSAKKPLNLINHHSYSKTENSLLSSLGQQIILESFDCYLDENTDSVKLYLSVYHNGKEESSECVGAMSSLAQFIKGGYDEARITAVILENPGNYEYKLTIDGFGTFAEYPFREFCTKDSDDPYTARVSASKADAQIVKGEKIELFAIGFNKSASIPAGLGTDDPAALKALDRCFILSCEFN